MLVFPFILFEPAIKMGILQCYLMYSNFKTKKRKDFYNNYWSKNIIEIHHSRRLNYRKMRGEEQQYLKLFFSYLFIDLNVKKRLSYVSIAF